MPWWPSCLDRGALINVDAPGCGTLVVRGPTGQKLYPKVSSPKVPTSRHVQKLLNRVLIKKRPSVFRMSESASHQRGPLGRTVP